MKLRCNPIIRYAPWIIVAILMVPLIVLTVKSDDSQKEKIISCVLYGVVEIISVFEFLYCRQYVTITDDEVVLKNAFGTMVRIKTADCVVYTTKLVTSARYGSVDEWICIYDKNDIVPFVRGCSNSGSYNRIQVISTDANYRAINSKFEIKQMPSLGENK